MSVNIQPRTERDIINDYTPLIERPFIWVVNMLGAISQYPLQQGYTNTAGQTISNCDAIIPLTLARMERRLQTEFAAAAARPGMTSEAISFLATAKEVQDDTAVLSPLFNVKNGSNYIGGDAYTFMVDQDMTLEAGIDLVHKSMQPVKVTARQKRLVTLQPLEALSS